jgi:hypothetical protein
MGVDIVFDAGLSGHREKAYAPAKQSGIPRHSAVHG